MWQGATLWVIDAKSAAQRETQSTDFHAHHAIQLTVSLGGWFRLSSEHELTEGNAVAVAADASHRFEAEGLIAIIFVEPESRQGRAITGSVFGAGPVTNQLPSVQDLAEKIAGAYRDPTGNNDTLIALGSAVITRIVGGTNAHTPDLRVRKVITWANTHIDRPISLAEAAGFCGLSPDRLRHLFVEHTGLQFRTYLLWLRLTRAVALLAAGRPATEAAHEAGFSDSAHFSRTFRRMFGVAPANLRIS